MLFTTIEFFIFFIIVTSLYFLIPQRFKWVFLLLASYYFYMCWKAEYILLIAASTLIDYLAGIMMEKTSSLSKRRIYLSLSLVTNLGLLFIFKYFNFFSDSVRDLFQTFHLPYEIPALNVILPVGISFYTFQTMGYTIDVYRGEKKAERHLGKFALYVSFFPQLVAGPIERSRNLLPQFSRPHSFDYQRVTDGLKLALWGLFKKVVIADRLSFFVDNVYNHVEGYHGPVFVIATVFFAFQIYCDFSGYSDIAIGTAQVLGFKLMDNFNRPYFAKSIPEFWRRWHISLSTWFRDYLYIPLGGNRVSTHRWYWNLLIVFILSGLWHGANWTFLVWGALHGLYMLGSIWTSRLRYRTVHALKLQRYPRLHKALRVLITFALVCFAWIFFRANSIGEAFYIVTHLFDGWTNPETLKFALSGFGLGTRSFILAVATIMFMEYIHLIQRHTGIRHMLSEKSPWIRVSVYFSMIAGIILFGNFSNQPFIYFQF